MNTNVNTLITIIELNWILLKLHVLQTLFKVNEANPELTEVYYEYNDDYVPCINFKYLRNLPQAQKDAWINLMAISNEPTDMDAFKENYINSMWDKYTSDIPLINFDSMDNTPVIYYEDGKIRWDKEKVKPSTLQTLVDISQPLCMLLFNEVDGSEEGMVFEMLIPIP
jgi:hypothetical protein